MGLAPTGLAGALALQQQVAVPQVVGAAKGVCLAGATAQGVVAVVAGLGDAVAADLGTAHLVGGVPAQLGVAVLRQAWVGLGAADQVAVGVVLKTQVLVGAQSVVGQGLDSPIGRAGAEDVAGGIEHKGKQPAKSSIQSPGHSVFMSTPISADMSPIQFLS